MSVKPKIVVQLKKATNMKMIKNLGLALAVASMMTLSARAIPITGTIDMSGTAFLDNVLLGSADGVSSFGTVTIGGVPTGSFTGTAGLVTWNAFSWNPPSTPVVPLWSFGFGGRTYSFDLTSITVDSQDNTFLNLLGSGVLKITGAGPTYDDTFGAWSFTISNPTGGAHANFAFTFANSQTAAAPDAGGTLILLGGAIMGLMGIARKTVRA
jgi:hypothetical protein